MATYVDSRDRKWKVSITGYEVKRVRETVTWNRAGETVPLNLCSLFDDEGELLLEMFNDISMMGDVLWSICEEEAEGKNVTEKQFRQGLTGDAIDSASEALREAIVDFFPPQRRQLVKRYFEKLLSLQPLIQEAQAEYLDGLDIEKEIKTRINELTGSKSTKDSSNLPESSAVIPTDGVYAN